MDNILIQLNKAKEAVTALSKYSDKESIDAYTNAKKLLTDANNDYITYKRISSRISELLKRHTNNEIKELPLEFDELCGDSWASGTNVDKLVTRILEIYSTILSTTNNETSIK